MFVTDGSDASLPGAQLTLTAQDTGVTRHAQTDSVGHYHFTALPIGVYQLSTSKDGFNTEERQGINLNVGQIATLTVKLAIASAQQSVVVTGDTPIVDSARTTVGGVVDQAQIDNLPINGRDFLNFAPTVAGVTSQQTSGQGSGLSFNGQRGRSNNIMLDGVENNGQLNGDVRTTMSQDAVQQFQVVTNLFPAEYGNAGGGLVNIVSKSGGNKYHGDLFYFARDASMDARNYFTNTAKPTFSRKDPGMTLGGPIDKGKTFFFGSVEYIGARQYGQTTITDSNVAAINAVLASRPIPGSDVKSIANGSFPVMQTQTLASFRIDHNFNENNQLTFRYLYGLVDQSNSGGISIGNLTDVSGGGGLHEKDNAYLVSYTHIFNPTMLNELRFQYAPQHMTQYANDAVGPRITISGVANWGRSVDFPVLLNESHYQWHEALSKSKGKHFFKVGGDVDYISAYTSFPVSFAGSFTFASLSAFQSGTPTTFSQGFGDPDIKLPDTLISVWAEDEWKPTPRFTLDYGLRWDYDMQPQGFKRNPSNPIEAPLDTGMPREAHNFGPRVAMAYSLDSSSKTVLRAGYGLFYDKLFLLAARNTLLARQSISMTGSAATAQFAAGAFPESNQYPTGVNIPTPSINRVDPNLVLPYDHQASLTIDRALSANWHVQASYVYVHGVRMIKSANTNLEAPSIDLNKNDGAQKYGRPIYSSARLNPEFNNIETLGSWGSSIYNALELTLEHRFAHGFSFRANYIYSKAEDDASDFTQAMQANDPYNPRAEWSLSDEDQRNRFTAIGVWNLPYHHHDGRNSALSWVLGDWVASTLVSLHGFTPYNITVGSDVNGDNNSSTDRPIVDSATCDPTSSSSCTMLGRNTGKGPRLASADFRLAKRIPLHRDISAEFLAEGFNIFNHPNFDDQYTTWGTGATPRSTLGQYTGAGDPREVQLGAKLYF
ncbi:MAG: carboxypeptidase regulatory-like domain-containing protein [Acidobacteriaceae bacterium]|nr:carboxypeptidase regulatory-like domain-containing protein [Acidobacteriaceae bacterium]